MEQRLEVNAKNEAEAVKRALEELDLEEDEVETHVEVLAKGSKGLLGLVGAKENRFMVSVRAKNAVTEEQESHEDGQKKEIGLIAESFLAKALELMKVSAKIKAIEEDEDTLKIEIEGEDSGIIIGRRGQTLDALQYIVSIVANREAAAPKRVVLDVEEYRARRIAELEELAKRIAGQVAQRGESIALRPMSAYERRIIHMALQDNDEVKTVSEGEDPERRVLIVPKG